MSLADFEIVKTTRGVTSIRNIVVNEIMHNPVGPWLEANALYVEQSKLAERLQSEDEKPLVLYDVGLGSGSNAVASIKAALGLPEKRRKLHVVSFENNLSLLEFTLIHSHEFDHLTGMEDALRAILYDHHWESPCKSILWDLRVGSFVDSIEVEPEVPELIFYQPYSPKVNSEMWTLSCFQKLRDRCTHNETPAILFTYSIATPIRSAMLLAGFYVGYGVSTGLKTETTQASTHFGELNNPLSERWFTRWQRSHMKLPFDAENYDATLLHHKINTHEQFAQK